VPIKEALSGLPEKRATPPLLPLPGSFGRTAGWREHPAM
jgi:hypothetical protein